MTKCEVLLLACAAATAAATTSGGAAAAATNGSQELPFTIGPAASRLSPAFRTAAVTWGLSVVKGDGDGLYHGYAAAMTNGCSLGAWTTNSEVVHTVSEVPTGPFRYKDTAIPAFAHNPRVARAPDGTYVLFTIGRPITKGQQCDCSPGGKPHQPVQPSTQVTFIHHATSPDGPWTALDPNGTLGLTNPTPHIFLNGSVVVVGLGNCTVAGSRSQGCAQVATAPTWRGPYTVDWRGQHGLGPWCANRGTWVFEDPFVWFSAKRGAWSMMVHQYNRSDAANQVLDGGYATSADESIYSNWTWGSHQQPLYTGLVTYADGSSDMMVRRERPSLLFSDEGEPSVLYTAVCPPGDHGGSYCYTVANPLTVKTDDELVLPETDWFASAQHGIFTHYTYGIQNEPALKIDDQGVWSPPRPNPRQLDFMEMEFAQFMHFGINTFWNASDAYLHGDNPTFHNCYWGVAPKPDAQTGKHWPCLDPIIFSPTDLNCDDWMRAAKDLGTKEICLTAQHEGGFALWPSNYTKYSVAASPWKNGKGDVLREFADAANRWGIKICYYLQAADDGWGMHHRVPNYTAASFIETSLGKLKEVLTEYGPVNRFWFDGDGFGGSNTPGQSMNMPAELNVNDTLLWEPVFKLIRESSPLTLLGPKKGDYCESNGGRYTVYVNNNGPGANNGTNTDFCTFPNASGLNFSPLESHGVTIQEGPDGNTDALPTYWFWHPWACAGNKSGCPWVGHSNASRLLQNWLGTVGHGSVLTANIPPERTGRMNVSVAKVMAQVGAAINNTFLFRHVGPKASALKGKCIEGFAEIRASSGDSLDFDYIMSMEEMENGQIIANYSVEYERVSTAGQWEMLVQGGGDCGSYPGVSFHCYGAGAAATGNGQLRASLGDPVAGYFPRDQHVGFRRIDVPQNTSTYHLHGGKDVAAVRFSCLGAYADMAIELASFSLHKKCFEWEGCAGDPTLPSSVKTDDARPARR